MTRRITLIIGIAVAALAVGVPVASASATPYWHDGFKNLSTGASGSSSSGAPVLRRSAADSPGNVDLRRRHEARNASHVAVVVSDDDGVKWPELGIGLGLGVLLGVGVLVGLGGARHRPLAH